VSPPEAFYVAKAGALVEPELMLRAFARAADRSGVRSYTVTWREAGYVVTVEGHVEQAAIVAALGEVLAETQGASP